MIAIPLYRRSRPWKICKILFLSILLFFFLFLFLPLLYDIPRGSIWKKGNFLFTEELERTLLLMAISFVFSWILLRKRFFLIDKSRGVLFYSLPCIGKRTYFMVEVHSILMEVDMSEALVRLKGDNLHRVYLRLRSGKTLLITEEIQEKKAREIASFLKEIFSVEIEQMQRIGWKRGIEINLGKYTILKELSHGGMGKVFLALDKGNGKNVAIKILPASMALEEKSVRSFVREIQILQKLVHPGIVRFLDYGRDQGVHGDVYFYAMEFLEGRPLTSFIFEKS